MRNNLIKGTFLFDHNRYIFILTLTEHFYANRFARSLK